MTTSRSSYEYPGLIRISGDEEKVAAALKRLGFVEQPPITELVETEITEVVPIALPSGITDILEFSYGTKGSK